jgi:hypothetical protein
MQGGIINYAWARLSISVEKKLTDCVEYLGTHGQKMMVAADLETHVKYA